MTEHQDDSGQHGRFEDITAGLDISEQHARGFEHSTAVRREYEQAFPDPKGYAEGLARLREDGSTPLVGLLQNTFDALQTLRERGFPDTETLNIYDSRKMMQTERHGWNLGNFLWLLPDGLFIKGKFVGKLSDPYMSMDFHVVTAEELLGDEYVPYQSDAAQWGSDISRRLQRVADSAGK